MVTTLNANRTKNKYSDRSFIFFFAAVVCIDECLVDDTLLVEQKKLVLHNRVERRPFCFVPWEMKNNFDHLDPCVLSCSFTIYQVSLSWQF